MWLLHHSTLTNQQLYTSFQLQVLHHSLQSFLILVTSIITLKCNSINKSAILYTQLCNQTVYAPFIQLPMGIIISDINGLIVEMCRKSIHITYAT